MTRIYALTDSHQESRNLSTVLSGIYSREFRNNTQFLIFDGGDLFKGIYDKNLSVNAYIKIKELLPQALIFLTLGNNDFGFNKKDFEYLKTTVKTFKKVGINIVCANLKDIKSGLSPQWVDKYKIIQIDGKRILITGFCVNNSCAQKFGYLLDDVNRSFKSLMSEIVEKYDYIVVLNHHWYEYSKKLKQENKQINLIIGGHEHSPIAPDYENNIFYPLSFARTMYTMELNDKIESIEQISINEISISPEFEAPIIEYEKNTKLKEPVAKRVLNLTKKYSDPCPLGTFISDAMKEIGNTQIAFHSTGFTMAPLRLEDSNVITKYDVDKVICASSPIEKVELTIAQLKKVYENATKNRMIKTCGNSRFVQSSQNVTIVGKGNIEDKTYKILQITIDGEDLLDKNQKPIDLNRKITCTIDSYIGNGEQGFEVLKNIPKTPILHNGQPVALNALFYDALLKVSKKFGACPYYPSSKIEDRL